MLKRVMIIGLLAISAVLMLGTEAKAQSLFGVQFFWGSIDCRSILNGLGKKAAPNTEVECQAQIKQFVGACRNHSGKPDSSGSHIFRLQTLTPPVGVTMPASGCQLNKVTGKWFCDESITDEQLEAALEPVVGDVCPNPNFTFTVDLVTQMCATVNVNSCHIDTTTTACNPQVITDGSCVCDILQDTVTARCSLPPGSAPGTQYTCNEITDINTQCVFH